MNNLEQELSEDNEVRREATKLEKQHLVNVIQTSRSRSLGQKLWNDVKGLVTRNAHVQYENPNSFGLKVMAKVKVFEK